MGKAYRKRRAHTAAAPSPATQITDDTVLKWYRLMNTVNSMDYLLYNAQRQVTLPPRVPLPPPASLFLLSRPSCL